MPRLIFERTSFELDAPDGGALQDLCDEHPRAGIPFSCRHANCGTCRVEVREGMPLCAPPDEDERALLEHLNATPAHRLACQLRVLGGDGRVRLWVTL